MDGVARGSSVQHLCMRDLKKFARYTNADEQIELATQYRLEGRAEDRNLLVRTGTFWGVKLAYQFARRYNCQNFILDLIQEAMLGLIIAAEKFDPTLGFKYSTYASWWVK